MTDHHPYLLPQRLQEIAALIGAPAAIAIAREWGGGRLYCPERLPRDHKLARLIGRQAAEILCHRYSREHLDIPSARSYLRWWDARMLRAQGYKISDIAKRLRINVTHARHLLRGFKADADAGETAPEHHDRRCPACGRGAAAHKRAGVAATNQLDFWASFQGGR